MAAIAGGNIIVLAGLDKKIQSDFHRIAVFECQYGIHYKSSKISGDGSSIVDMNYQKDSFINNWLNNCHGSYGKKGPKIACFETQSIKHDPLGRG